MDYAGWELERQRRALAALLLGGGAAREDGEGDAGRRSPETAREGAGAAGQTAAGTYGRYAAGPGAPEGWDALREARRASRDGEPETPPSAWESILSGPAPAGWDRTADAGPGDGDTARGEERRSSGGRTGEAEDSGRRTVRNLEGAAGQRGAPELRTPASPAGETPDGDGATPGQRPSGTAADGEESVRRESGGSATGGGWISVPRGSPAADASPLGETGLAWGGGGETALRAEEDAKALSRAVQRDARRYDGGFAIY